MQRYSTKKPNNGNGNQTSMTDRELSEIVSTLKETDPAEIRHRIEERKGFGDGSSPHNAGDRAAGRQMSDNQNKLGRYSLFDSESSNELFKKKPKHKREYHTGTSSLRQSLPNYKVRDDFGVIS